MADGSVKIEVGLNIAKAEKDLAKLKEKIAKAEDQLNANSTRKSELQRQIAKVGAEADEATKKVMELKAQLGETSNRREKASIRASIAEATDEQRRLVTESNKLNDEFVKVSTNIEKGERNLTDMKEEAGQLSKQIERARPGDAIAKSMESARKSFAKFLKYAIGIRSVYILFQRLKSAIKNAVKEFAEYDYQTKLNLKTMEATKKAIQLTNGAALAGIYNAILPVIQKIANWMLEAANAASRFIAIISGKDSYKKAVVDTSEISESLEETSEAADDVAESAKEAKRQLMGFDELNILDSNKDNTSGGKAGKTGKPDKTATDGIRIVEEAIDGFDGSFLDNLALTVKDVLFDWSDLNPEQIAEKIIAGLGAVLGAALGIALGMGPGGVLLMTLGGLVLGLIADSIIFNHDGRIDAEEWSKMIMAALSGLLTGITWFVLTGSPALGLVGGLLGVALALTCSTILFNGDGTLSSSEVMNMIWPVLNAILGGVAGFVLTRNMQGAAFGAMIGFALTLGIESLEPKLNGSFPGLFSAMLALINSVLLGTVGFTLAGPWGALVGVITGVGLTFVIEHVKATISAKDAFYTTEFGQQLKAIQDRVQERMKADADIRMHIKSITGEVDDKTMADLTAAQKLIDQIFDLSEKKDKTTTEAKLLVELVNQLNGMNLEGIQLTFSETTGEIQQTRAEVNGLMEDLLKQYQMKAVADAYTESFKAQFEAETALAQAQKDHTAASAALAEAVQDNVIAQIKYNEALSDYERASSGFGNFYSEEANAARERMEAAEKALETTELAVKEARKTTEDTQAGLTRATETAEQAKDKVVAIGEAFKNTVENSSSATEAIVQNVGRGSEAYSQSAKQIKDDSGTVNEAFQSNVDASSTAADQVTQNAKQMGEGVSSAYSDVSTDATGTFSELKATVTGTTEDITRESTDDTKQLHTDVTGEYDQIHQDAVQTFGDISRNVPIIMDGMAQNINSSTMEISTSFQTLEQSIQSVINNIQSMDWSIPAPHIPHISWTYDTVYSDDGSSFNIPQFFVDWYAKGGVFDFPTLVGVGEDGKEAVVPLEKNTEWMTMVADGLMERITQSRFMNSLAAAFVRTPMPAMAGGGIIPPRAISNGGSMFSDSDIDRIVRGLSGFLGGDGRKTEIINKVYLDGKQIASSVKKWQRVDDRAEG